VQEISPVDAQQHPPPDGEMAELCLPEDPGGDGGKEPRKENCCKPPCSGGGGEDRWGKSQGDGVGDARGAA